MISGTEILTTAQMRAIGSAAMANGCGLGSTLIAGAGRGGHCW